MFKEFREFIMRGNVLDMAVGIIVGGAFGAITKSLVADVIMPPIGLLLGKMDFSNLFVVLRSGEQPGPYATVAAAQNAGAVTLNLGLFIMTIVNFLIIAAAVFLLIKSINSLRREKAAQPTDPTTKECPFCKSTIHIAAVRCPNCTSQL